MQLRTIVRSRVVAPSWAIILVLSSLSSCGPRGIEPVHLAARNGVEADVLALIDSSAAFARQNSASFEAHRRLAWSFEANALWDEAARSYSAVLELNPRDHLSRLHRAIVLQAIGADEEAFVELGEAADALPDVPAAQFRLGLKLLEFDRLDEAETRFKAVSMLLPRAPHGPYGVGLVALAKGNAEVARARLEEALHAAPGEPRILYALGQTYQASGHEDLARTYLQRGAGGAELQLPDSFSPRIEELGRSRTARLERAARLRAEGQLVQAIGVLRQTLASAPTDETALTSLSGVLIEASRFEEAATVIEDHLRQHPNAPDAHYNLSLLHCARGEAAEAIRAAKQAVELAPDVMYVRKQYGVALAQGGLYPDAYVQLSEAVRLGASDAAMQTELARLGQLQDLPDMAAEHFQRSLKIDPLNPIVHLNLIIALGDAGRSQEALAAFSTMSRVVAGHRAVDKALEYLRARGIQ